MRVPLPPEEYRRLVCGDDWPQFEQRGQEIAGMLRNFALLGEGRRLLDIGCGCGRLARFLLEEPIGSYDGFDRHPGMIDWCRREFATDSDRFSFHYFDLLSAYVALDGYAGSRNVANFRFPFAQGSFDTIVAASVFTHLAADDVRAYLRHIAHWLAPQGRALVSVFHVDGPAMQAGLGFYLSPDEFGDSLAAAALQGESPFGVRFGPLHNWYLLSSREPAK